MKHYEESVPSDPYIGWPSFLRSQDRARFAEGDQWELLLVEPRDADVFDKIAKDADLRVDASELQLVRLVQEAADVLPPFFLNRRQTDTDHSHLFRIVERSLPLAATIPQSALVEGEKHSEKDDPLLAVIDDGLGFLNERFQRATAGGFETRIESILIQSLKLNPPVPGGLVTGRILSRAEVQDLLQRPDERAVYKEINESVFVPDTLRSTEQADSHGSHIMDLAGGADPADPADPMRDVPMVLVQLPPQIVDDTSGRNMVPYILNGLHFILLQALVLGKTRVVVNLSFGITAGPKDGTSVFSKHVLFLINLAALLGIRLDVVVPFGNDYQNRLVAQVAVPKMQDASVDVRLQPDDRAPTYVEIRPEDDTEPQDIAVGIIAPNGTVIAPQNLETGVPVPITYRGETVGSLIHVPPTDGRLPYLSVTFAPTAPILDDALGVNATGPLIEAGNWSIVMRNTTERTGKLRIEIQRGDTIPGYRQRGRQAYFSDPEGYHYDIAPAAETGNAVQSKSYTKLGPDAYTTHDGTNSAFTVVPGSLGRFHTVGGAFLRKPDPNFTPDEQDPPVAAQYTSLNTRPGRGTPTAGARSEHNRVLPGLKGAGVLSGSTARFSGSSAAAAVYTRSLIMVSAPQADAAALGRLPAQVHAGRTPRD